MYAAVCSSFSGHYASQKKKKAMPSSFSALTDSPVVVLLLNSFTSRDQAGQALHPNLTYLPQSRSPSVCEPRFLDTPTFDMVSAQPSAAMTFSPPLPLPFPLPFPLPSRFSLDRSLFLSLSISLVSTACRFYVVHRHVASSLQQPTRQILSPRSQPVAAAPTIRPPRTEGTRDARRAGRGGRPRRPRRLLDTLAPTHCGAHGAAFLVRPQEKAHQTKQQQQQR